MIPFAIVGGIFNFIEFGGSYFLIEKGNLSVSLGYALAYIVATIVAFVLNTFFTFKSKFTWTNLFRYVTIYIIAMGIGQLVILFMTKVIDIQSIMTIRDGWLPLFTLPFVYLWNFSMTNRFLKK
jgi:putative flippase GtrA